MNNQSKRVCVEVAVNTIKVTMYGIVTCFNSK